VNSSYLFKYKLKKKYFFLIRDVDFLNSFVRKHKAKKHVLRIFFFKKYYKKYFYT